MEQATRIEGRVCSVKNDFGFIATEAYPNNVYFKQEWCADGIPLAFGELVTFEVRSFEDGRVQAHSIERVVPAAANRKEPDPALAVSAGRLDNKLMLDWAYLGNLPETLTTLADLALEEQWSFRAGTDDPKRPFPILFNYLTYTFVRLSREGKIATSSGGLFASFNTGLVDDRYEPIYALFRQNPGRKQPWRLDSFCIAAEGRSGQELVRNFNPLPQAAHYFDDPSELLYDFRAGKPEMNWEHIVIDHVDRYPIAFIEDVRPAGFEIRDPTSMAKWESDVYHNSLRQAFRNNARAYRNFMGRVKDALELSIKRVSWNFKTAIPQYYAAEEKLQLLLPLCLVQDDVVDVALATERTPAGSYIGHTVFPLDWAYRNARLICRPDSDWLVPGMIDDREAAFTTTETD